SGDGSDGATVSASGAACTSHAASGTASADCRTQTCNTASGDGCTSDPLAADTDGGPGLGPRCTAGSVLALAGRRAELGVRPRVWAVRLSGSGVAIRILQVPLWPGRGGTPRLHCGTRRAGKGLAVAAPRTPMASVSLKRLMRLI